MSLKIKICLLSFLSWIPFLFPPSTAFADFSNNATSPTCTLYPSSGNNYSAGTTIKIYMQSYDTWLNNGIKVDLARNLDNSFAGRLTSNCSIPDLPLQSVPISGSPFSWTPTATESCTFIINIRDNTGNPGQCQTQVSSSLGLLNPWLKTTGGDVHSNKGITAPGGPQ